MELHSILNFHHLMTHTLLMITILDCILVHHLCMGLQFMEWWTVLEVEKHNILMLSR